MSSHETLTRIAPIIAANRQIPEESVSLDARLLEDLDIDSLAATEILFDIEDEFEIVVPEQRTFGLTTVRELCEAVEALVRPS